jgi:cytoskeleton protein RodZ
MNETAALPGIKLKAERERRGLSAQKAADEMHLDRWVIDALEADDYTRIGPTVYAKGHLKKYAALLGLPAAEILAGYESRPAGPVKVMSAGPSMLLTTRDERSAFGSWSPAQIAGCLLAALLLAGVLWWRPWHQRGNAPVSTPPVAAAATAAASDAQGESGTVSAAPASPAALNDVSSAPAATAVADNAASATPPEAGAAPPPGTGRARLRLSFSADSWVDVHDAAGKRTFAGNGLANSVKNIAGAAPLRVYLGFGSGVQLEINDRAVAIGPQFFAGDVARFEAGADGVLRRDTRSDPHNDSARSDQAHSASPRNARPPG